MTIFGENYQHFSWFRLEWLIIFTEIVLNGSIIGYKEVTYFVKIIQAFIHQTRLSIENIITKDICFLGVLNPYLLSAKCHPAITMMSIDLIEKILDFSSACDRSYVFSLFLLNLYNQKQIKLALL